ncbi:hypothetical protein CRG98_006020 [Punica granatum]|uniref:Uncharacterized protein n=1 Tax=Punica granatum TaxID=22663 RepID=A0A2I0KYN9_PUNGR|nr:hypothetical protein CRG98_006020 [Punica granatum]
MQLGKRVPYLNSQFWEHQPSLTQNLVKYGSWTTMRMRFSKSMEKKLYVLEQPLPAPPPDNATRAERDAYRKHQDDAVNVGCLMLTTMDLELQKQQEHMGVYDMIVHLRQLYQEQARHEWFDVSKKLFQAKLTEGSPSLPSSYSQFVMNYNMNDYNKPLPELLSMLRTTEQDISKGMLVLMVQGTKKKG